MKVIYCDDLPWNYGEDVKRPKGTKCTSSMLKNYSGCMCEGCMTFKSIKSPWVVGVHGTFKPYDEENEEMEEYEIFVSRENNFHAFKSWGWGNPNWKHADAKIMILDGAVDDEDVFNDLIKIAQKRAIALNKRDRE